MGSRKRWFSAFCCVFAAVLVFGLCPAARADEQTVSNVFVETDLRQALEDIAAQAGVNIIADSSVQGVVTVSLQNASVDKALELLLAGSKYMVQKTPDYYLVYSPDDSSDVFSTVAETRTLRPSYVTPSSIKTLLPQSMQTYVRVDETAGMVSVTAPPVLLDKILDDIARLDQGAAGDTRVVPLIYVKAAAARDLLPDELRRYVRADAERNVLAVSAPDPVKRQILQQLALLDTPRPAGSFDVPDAHPTQIFKLSNATAKTTLALLPAALQTYVEADETTNTLSISAPSVLLGQIISDIRTIDSPRQHIMLDARVVSLESADLLNFGGQWSMPKISAGTVVGDAVKWPWEVAIGYTPDRQFTDALTLTLNLLSQNNQATIIANPQVLAQDGVEADIQATTEEYFPISASSGTATGTYVQTSLEKIQTGTILKITPQIGPNGEITLSMDIEVSDVVARGEQNLPVVSRRTAHSTVQVLNGGTAAIAGLVDTRLQVGDSGVPGFANVPLLGRAFRTETLNNQTRQVAVFITATIVQGNDPQFQTGNPKKSQPVAATNPGTYRQELSNALAALGATPQ